MDLGELSNDEEFKSKILEFHNGVEEVGKILDVLCASDVYESLSEPDKVRYDLFQSFAINSLFWLYLRTQGIDPNQHGVKSEINRVKEYMSKSKRLHERNTIMPRINQDAAKRFVNHSLWMPNQAKTSDPKDSVEESSSKKRKRDDSE